MHTCMRAAGSGSSSDAPSHNLQSSSTQKKTRKKESEDAHAHPIGEEEEGDGRGGSHSEDEWTERSSELRHLNEEDILALNKTLTHGMVVGPKKWRNTQMNDHLKFRSRGKNNK
uniref:Uncharacterized protein n=1 Tax=Chromera velia CCMP2878 TaxID=1169474 RepID=A0A0G4GA03_9ALVE|eukprot:Cvel_20810.t1-p1 / transcript=Cvel_20810.t1 / gene=Cvel_20810 / organism=Chromera_velia_CCMP2878 / gene_product=hypothetical protein / transcript_product=hypothetical protein / location=Cvel_scaffold1901:34633-36712(-) / protein_length=113 / sequence_SO=supercontig / SO=protein_coding / is_pseudo=false